MAPSNAYLNFAARTRGLNDAQRRVYQAFLDGLTTDGLFNSDGTSSYFDWIYVFRTNSAANARLNLVGDIYNATVAGSPTFTANSGYTGTLDSSTDNIDSNFNPSTASSPKYVRDSAHVSVWVETDLSTDAVSIGCTAGSSDINITPRFNTDGKAYYRINEQSSAGVTTADSLGFYLANRSGASTQQAYKNAVDQGMTGVASVAVPNATITVLNKNGASRGDSRKISFATCGASLTQTQVTNLYNRIVDFRNGVQAPADASTTAYDNFIARVTGASNGLKAAYKGLLVGLTTDGLFNADGTSSVLDCLYRFDTQDATTARLNLVQ